MDANAQPDLPRAQQHEGRDSGSLSSGVSSEDATNMTGPGSSASVPSRVSQRMKGSLNSLPDVNRSSLRRRENKAAMNRKNSLDWTHLHSEASNEAQHEHDAEQGSNGGLETISETATNSSSVIKRVRFATAHKHSVRNDRSFRSDRSSPSVDHGNDTDATVLETDDEMGGDGNNLRRGGHSRESRQRRVLSANISAIVNRAVSLNSNPQSRQRSSSVVDDPRHMPQDQADDEFPEEELEYLYGQDDEHQQHDDAGQEQTGGYDYLDDNRQPPSLRNGYDDQRYLYMDEAEEPISADMGGPTFNIDGSPPGAAEALMSSMARGGKPRGASDNLPPSVTVIHRFEDYDPQEGRTYFVPAHTYKRRMCAVIPCYNEPDDALKRTLFSLEAQFPKLDKLDFEFFVVIILDGWKMASGSMKEYLRHLFPMPENERIGARTWWEYLDDPDGPEPETLIIQNVDTSSWRTVGVDIDADSRASREKELSMREDVLLIGDKDNKHANKEMLRRKYARKLRVMEKFGFKPEIMRRMNIQLVVKRDNRRKHNSLEWFFGCFANEYRAEYGFTTDCGTLFEKNTIYHLARHLDLFPHVAGCTGRQRVMSAAQQGELQEDWYSAWMRACQGFEYEATFASYVGAFSLSGMLPVIPGPCGLFNMTHMRGRAVKFFFDTVKQDPDTAGLLLGNGLLAEDRFLTYAAAIATDKPTITEFVPESTFYFEAETDLRTFVAQRRRWNNGTFACFVWLMKNLSLIRNTPHSWMFKLMNQFLIIWQVLWLAFSLISPAFFITLLRLGFRHTFPSNEENGKFWADMVCVAYLGLYLTFIALHTSRKYASWMFHIFTLLHALAVCFILSTFIHAAITRRDPVVELTMYLFAVYQGAPVLLSLIISPRSCFELVKTFVPYMLFLPTQTMTFWTYALTRTFDLTWGNRPTTHKLPEDERGLFTNIMRESALALVAVVATANVLISLLMLQIASMGETMWIVWILVGLMTFAGVQMSFSFLFAFDYHVIRRIRRMFRSAIMNRHRKQISKDGEDTLRSHHSGTTIKHAEYSLTLGSLPGIDNSGFQWDDEALRVADHNNIHHI